MTKTIRKAKTSENLAYHEISDEAPKYLYGVSRDQFRNHVQCVKQLVDAGILRKSTCQISFDDGHVSQYRQGLPILQDAGIIATFFVTPGWTEKRTGYMSWQQLREVVKCGHEVESHGWSHKLLTQCNPGELKEELIKSKMELEQRLGTKVVSISVPGGRWNDAVLAMCAEAGYERVFTSDPWMPVGGHFGVEVTGRWMVTRKMGREEINTRLSGRGVRLHFLKASHSIKAAVKNLLGDRFYQTVWRALSGKRQSMELLEERAANKPEINT